MKLEQQVTSLELAKKLKELGLKQESLFYWILFHGGVGKGHSDYERSATWELRTKDSSLNFQESRISAYTVAELGEMLPEYLVINDRVVIFTTRHNREDKDTGWEQGYEFAESLNDEDVGWVEVEQAETEADARAKMLIHLHEQGLLKPNQKKDE
jgi:hypothetical protein